MSTVLSFGDNHFPYDLTEFLDHLKYVCDIWQPDIIANTGDMFDHHAINFQNGSAAISGADLFEWPLQSLKGTQIGSVSDCPARSESVDGEGGCRLVKLKL